MLPESRLYSFIDQELSYGIQFLEGQRLIQDLALIHNLNQPSFKALRNMLLSAQPLISLLKHNEGMGLYIDNDEPYLRFKLETHHDGALRTLLLPEELDHFPDILTGIVRLSKISPSSMHPYNSAIELNRVPATEVVNKILLESYQMKSVIKVADNVDQAVMIQQFPRPNVNKEELEERPGVQEYWLQKKRIITELFQEETTDQEVIENLLKKEGLAYLGSRQVKFQCSCSKDRMLMGVAGLVQSEGYDEVFGEGKKDLEAKCDYCKSFYDISRKEIESHFLKINQ